MNIQYCKTFRPANKGLIILTLIVALVAIKTNAQIIYTDIDPDTTLSNLSEHYEFDLNNDAQNDFDIWLLDAGLGCNSVEFFGVDANNEALGYSSGGSNYASALVQGTNIEPSSGMWIDFLYYLNKCGTNGDWINVHDKYMGLRTKINSQWHYGWVRIDIDSLPSLVTIKDYAYNSVPNEVILAGDKGPTGIKQVSFDAFNLSLYQNRLSLELRQPVLKALKVRLINHLGQVIKTVVMSTNYLEISLDSYAPGLYLIVASNGNIFYSQKFIIK